MSAGSAERSFLTLAIERCVASRGGNIAIIFALSLLPLVLAIGGAIDFARTVSAVSMLQSAVDNASLAAANLRHTNSPVQTAQAYVHAAVTESGLDVQNLNVSVNAASSDNSREVILTVTADVPTTFLGMMGWNVVPISLESKAKEVISNVEISLVLDVSSSMNGARITNLRQASISFINQVLADDYVAATTVSLIPFGGTVRLPVTFHPYLVNTTTYTHPVNGYVLPVPADPSNWNGCLEMDPSEVSSITLTPGSLGLLPTFKVFSPGRGWCPTSDSAKSIFLSNNKADIISRLNDFDTTVLSDGTGTDVGTSWGVRALDPAWRGKLGAPPAAASRPADFGEATSRKFLIVMTDGGITGQIRPKPGWTPPTPEHVGGSGSTTVYSRTAALTSFHALCDHAKDNGVVVYTIAFQVTNPSHQNEMRVCASSPGHFYNVEGLDIDAAFSSIASQISALRLVQ